MVTRKLDANDLAVAIACIRDAIRADLADRIHSRQFSEEQLRNVIEALQVGRERHAPNSD